MQLDSCGVADANQGSSQAGEHAVKVLALLDCGMVRVGCATDCRSCRSFLSNSGSSNNPE